MFMYCVVSLSVEHPTCSFYLKYLYCHLCRRLTLGFYYLVLSNDIGLAVLFTNVTGLMPYVNKYVLNIYIYIYIYIYIVCVCIYIYIYIYTKYVVW